MDGEPEVWAKSFAFLADVAERDSKHRPGQSEHKRPLEVVFGPIINHLPSRKGIISVDPESRELLLNAFHKAMFKAVAPRERNAGGNYSPDPDAGHFPEFERAQDDKPSAVVRSP